MFIWSTISVQTQASHEKIMIFGGIRFQKCSNAQRSKRYDQHYMFELEMLSCLHQMLLFKAVITNRIFIILTNLKK